MKQFGATKLHKKRDACAESSPKLYAPGNTSQITAKILLALLLLRRVSICIMDGATERNRSNAWVDLHGLDSIFKLDWNAWIFAMKASELFYVYVIIRVNWNCDRCVISLLSSFLELEDGYDSTNSRSQYKHRCNLGAFLVLVISIKRKCLWSCNDH